MKLKDALSQNLEIASVKTKKEGRTYRVSIGNITTGGGQIYGVDRRTGRSFSGNTEVVSVRKQID
jgi:hypothetical protein